MDQLIRLIDKKIESIEKNNAELSARIKDNYERIRFFNNCRSNINLVDDSLIDEMFELNDSNSKDFDFIKFIISENLYDQFKEQSQVQNAIEMFATAASAKIIKIEEINSSLNAEKQKLFRTSSEINKYKRKLIDCYKNKTFFDKELIDFITDLINNPGSYDKELIDELLSILSINTLNLENKKQIEEQKNDVISQIEDSLKEVVEEPVKEETPTVSLDDKKTYSQVWDELAAKYEMVLGGNYGVLFVCKDGLFGVCSAKTGDVIIPCKCKEYSEAYNLWGSLNFPTEKVEDELSIDQVSQLLTDYSEELGNVVDGKQIESLLKNSAITGTLLQLYNINKSLENGSDKDQEMSLLKQKLELQLKLQDLLIKESKIEEVLEENKTENDISLENDEKVSEENEKDAVYNELKSKFDLVVKDDGGVYFVSKNNSYGVYSFTGEEIMPCQYKEYSEAYHYWSNLGFPRSPIEEEINPPIDELDEELTTTDEEKSVYNDDIEKNNRLRNVRRIHHGGVTTEVNKTIYPSVYADTPSKKETKKDFYNPDNEKNMLKDFPNLTEDQIAIVENINNPRTIDVIRDAIDKFVKTKKPNLILTNEYIIKFVKVCLFNECSSLNMIEREALFNDLYKLHNESILAVEFLYQLYAMNKNVNTKEEAGNRLGRFFGKYRKIFEKYDYEIRSGIIPRPNYNKNVQKSSLNDINDIFQPIFEDRNEKVEEPIISKNESVKEETKDVPIDNANNMVFDKNFNAEVEELKLSKSLMSDDLSFIQDCYLKWVEKVVGSKEIYQNNQEFYDRITNKKNYFSDIEKILKDFSKTLSNESDDTRAFYPLIYAHGLKLTLNYNPSNLLYNFNTLLYYDRILLHQFGDESRNENYIYYLEDYARANNDNAFLEVINYMKSINKDELINLPKYSDLKTIQDDIVILIVSEQMSLVKARHIMKMVQQFKESAEQAKNKSVSR
ncbi:MAG: hypothetical protein J5634_00020 [Bacilli bacterium]|nr:hypothetical protein [Bacilli bacterium]